MWIGPIANLVVSGPRGAGVSPVAATCVVETDLNVVGEVTASATVLQPRVSDVTPDQNPLAS